MMFLAEGRTLRLIRMSATLIFCAAWITDAHSEEPSASEIVEHFQNVVFHRIDRSTSNQPALPLIVKPMKAIRVRVFGKLDSGAEHQLKHLLMVIRKTTSLELSMVRGNEFDLAIVAHTSMEKGLLVSRQLLQVIASGGPISAREYEKKALRLIKESKSNCLAFQSYSTDGGFVGLVVVKSDQSRDQIAVCFAHRIAGFIGLKGLSKDAPSVRHRSGQFKDFSKLDLAVLKLLYSPKITLLMPANEAMDQVRSMVGLKTIE